MRLEWSTFSLEDRDRIFDYLMQENPLAAVAVDTRISEQVGILMEYPEAGRPGRIEGTRELVINRTPCIAAYRLMGDTVRVLRILHGAQLWPESMSED